MKKLALGAESNISMWVTEDGLKFLALKAEKIFVMVQLKAL